MFQTKLRLLSYLITDTCNQIFNDEKPNQSISLLGYGPAGEGFLKHINHKKFDVGHYYLQHENTAASFNNTQTDTQFQIEKNDYNKGKSRSISQFITGINFENGSYDYVSVGPRGETKLSSSPDITVVALGNDQGQYNTKVQKWESELKKYNPWQLPNGRMPRKLAQTSIVGSGLVGTEMIFKIRDTFPCVINLYDALPEEKLYSYLSPKGKEFILAKFKIKNNYIKTNFGKMFDGDRDDSNVIFAVGEKPNQMTCKQLQNDDFSTKVNDSMFMIGDCSTLSHPKTGQHAYAQGKYVAEKLNAETNILKCFTATFSKILFLALDANNCTQHTINNATKENLQNYYTSSIKSKGKIGAYNFKQHVTAVYIGNDEYCIDITSLNYCFVVDGWYVRKYYKLFC
jgi:NADH dehydrogenase FAD-containing subunit